MASFCEFAMSAAGDAFEQIVSAVCIVRVVASYDSRFAPKGHCHIYQW
jgi:hypothetical protein